QHRLGFFVELEQSDELLEHRVLRGALELERDGIFGKELAQAHSRAKGKSWLLRAQRAITFQSMHFPYSVAHDFPLFLAPMAGVSESPFRQLCRGYGADVVVAECVSPVGIALGSGRVVAEVGLARVGRALR